MITIQTICGMVPGLTEPVLQHYIAQEWVRPTRRQGAPAFAEIDVARIRLIRELHTELEVEEPTVPLILSLLDQLHATRRQLRLVLDALDAPVREALAGQLAAAPDED